MNIEITSMTTDDLEKIKNCLLEDFDDFWSVSVLKQELENKQNLNSNYFVAKMQDKIVGFVGIITVIDEVTIMNIVVHKANRGLGIGSHLLEFIIDFAKNNHVSSITLEVNEKNLAAISLYKKFNFIQVGLRRKYYHNADDAILMTLTIL